MKQLFNQKGLTLVELMVTASILAIGILVTFASFKYIGNSVQSSKNKSLATTLCQEQIEVMKNKNYYFLLVTTSSYNDTRFSPAITYDDTAYPISTVREGGITFYRATRVDYAYTNGSTISLAPATSDDTGMKQITVYVMWQDNGVWRYQELHGISGGVATMPLNSRILGTVTRSGTGTAISGAIVEVVDNPNYFGTTDASGNYSFLVAQGSYTVQVTTQGYFTTTTTSTLNVAANANVTQNFSLVLMGSRQVTSDIYLLDHPVISQVVGEYTSTLGTHEWIELYNPSTSTIYMGTGSGSYFLPNGYALAYNTSFPANWQWLYLTIVNSNIPPNGHYLISNSTAVRVGTTTVLADAYYHTASGVSTDTIKAPGSNASVILMKYAGSVFQGNVDVLGWRSSNTDIIANSYNETTAFSAALNSMLVGGSISRKASPTGVDITYGPAFDANRNSTDFSRIVGLTTPPGNTSSIKIPVAGTPATGAIVNFNDSISQYATCADTAVSGSTICRYTAYVATGTWTAIVSSGTYFLQISSVVVSTGTTTLVFPSTSTSPAWPATNYNSSLLKSATSYAFIAGTIRTTAGTLLSGITVTGGATSVTTGSTGRYFLAVDPGLVEVTANPSNQNINYSEEKTDYISTTAGQLYEGYDLNLGTNGRIRGYFKTSSNTPLPNRVAVALRGTDTEGQSSSDNTGYFWIKNLSSGSYVLQAYVDPIETVSPSSMTVTISSSGVASVSVATFTVTSGLAQVTGQVRASSAAITTGALVVVTTSSLGGTSASMPPSMSSLTTTCSPCYYAGSSDSLGNYTIDVRSNATAYNVYGWYTTFSGSTPTTTRVGPFSVTVSTPGVTATQNLSW